MATVQSTSASSASDVYAAINTANNSSTTTTSAAEEQQNRFLTLLVTQLKNQDPLNPMDNAQMTTQLAQMSTVTGIEKLNTTLNSLVESLASTQAGEASAMIGKSVMVPGSQLKLSSGAAYGAINPGEQGRQRQDQHSRFGRQRNSHGEPWGAGRRRDRFRLGWHDRFRDQGR